MKTELTKTQTISGLRLTLLMLRVAGSAVRAQTTHYFYSGFARFILLAVTTICMAGCGSVTVRHVPKPGAIATAKMSDLHGAQPLDVKAGECIAAETTFGTVGMGKVIGKPSEWTGAAVEAIKANLSSRGATLAAGASKTLTITMTQAEVKAVPIVGGAKSKIVLTATAPEGINSAFEGSDGSLAPLSSVNGAMKDAVEKLLKDSAVDAYVRK